MKRYWYRPPTKEVAELLRRTGERVVMYVPDDATVIYAYVPVITTASVVNIRAYKAEPFIAGTLIGQTIAELTKLDDITWNRNPSILTPKYSNDLDLETGCYGFNSQEWWIGIGKLHGRCFGCTIPYQYIQAAKRECS